MSLLGKILTALNAVAAIAFLVIAGLNYQMRHAWSNAVFRHELALHGLPLDDRDTGWRPGGPLIHDLTSATVKDLFPVQPVKTQQEALEFAKTLALAYIDQPGNTEAQRKEAVSQIWMPLLQNEQQRDDLRELLRTKDANALRDYVAAVFNAQEVDPKTIAGDPNRIRHSSPDVQRERIAHILFALEPRLFSQLFPQREGKQGWVQNVVGLHHYVEAADQQAGNLQAIVVALREQRLRDQDRFIRTYDELLPRLDVLSEQLKTDRARLEQHRQVFEEQKLLYEKRLNERNQLRTDLEQVRREATAETATLESLQKELFSLQQQLGERRTANQRLEAEIRSKEVGK